MGKQEMNRALRKQKMKMMLEALLRALLVGAAAGGLGFLILSAVYHVLVKEPPAWLILTVVLSAFGLFAVLSFALFFYPTSKRVARRVDGNGMEERVTTMLQYESSSSGAAKLQREDTVALLKEGSKVRTGFRMSLREIIAFAVCACLVTAMIFIPYDLFASAHETPEDKERTVDTIVDDMLKELREIIERHENDPEFKEELNEFVNDLEKDLKDSSGDLEKAAKIHEAAENLKEPFDREREEKNGDPERQKDLNAEEKEMKDALEKAKEEILDEHIKKIVDEMIEQLRQIIEEHDNDKDFEKELNDLVDNFEKELENSTDALDKAAKIGAMAQDLQEPFDTERAENVGQPEKIEDLNTEEEQMLAVLEAAKAAILQTEGEEEQPGEGEGEEPGGEETNPDGKGDKGDEMEDQQGGEHTPGGPGQGEAKIIEKIYDSDRGKIEYKEVFMSYYKEYIRSKESEEIPEDVRKLLDAYFGELSK